MPLFLEKIFQKKEMNAFGIYVNDIHSMTPRFRVLICLMNAVLIFLASYGTISGLLDAFSLPYHKLIVALFLIFVSAYLSLLYMHRVFFYVGYIGFLILYTRFLVQYYLYANSGFQAAVNEIYLKYSDFFQLTSVRHAQEFYTDRTMTITIACLFLGAFLAILLNVTISGYMHLFDTILVTFPFLEIAFFINEKPPVFSIFLLLTSYICIGLLSLSRHARMQVQTKKGKEYVRIRRNKKTAFLYQGNASLKGILLILSMIISLLICVGFKGIYESNTIQNTHNPIRIALNDAVKTYVQSGFSGLLNRYDAKGGLDRGRMGGISSVRPDFETDLVVTYAPSNVNTVYLKSFEGSFYAENTWYDNGYSFNPEYKDMNLTNINFSEEPTNESGSYTSPMLILFQEDINEIEDSYLYTGTSKGKMTIENIDAETYDLYVPYYTKRSDDNKSALSLASNTSDLSCIPLGDELTLYYYPQVGRRFPLKSDNLLNVRQYDIYVNDSCLYVPEYLKDMLLDYCITHNYPGIIEGEVKSSAQEEYVDINQYRLAVADAIYSDFVNHYPYTMSPGATPVSEDFVDYFLNTQQRGYCVHFASAAVMLLRTMGVPARYVEGYCIPPSLLADGTVISDANYDEWFEGDSTFPEDVVVRVEVNDSHAHAWIEIYMEGYGFVPYEMTPPSLESEQQTFFDFSNLLRGLFGTPIDVEPFDTEIGNTGNQTGNFSKGSLSILSGQNLLLPLATFAGIVLMLLFIYQIVRRVIDNQKIKAMYRNKNYAGLSYILYHQLIRKLKKTHATDSENPLPRECQVICTNALKKKYPEEEFNTDSTFDSLERALFSPKGISKEEYFILERQMQELIKKL